MKKLFPLMLVMLAIMTPMKLWAQEPYAVLTTDSATILSQDSTGVTYGKTLTFYYDNQRTARNGMSVGPFYYYLGVSWYDQREQITNVVFTDSFANCNSLTSTAYWFLECKQLTSITGISNLNTDNVTDMASMFRGCSSLTTLDVSNFKTDNVTNMSDMFLGCSGLTNLDVSNFKTDNVTSMSGMFWDCSGLTNLDVSNFKTDNVTGMNGMFLGCSGLTNLDVSNFKTDNVTGMSAMFSDCSGLTNLDVSNFKTDNVTNMSSMFHGCSGLTNLDVSNFKTDNVTGMSAMFSGCSGLTNLDVSNFKTDNVTDMMEMFEGCSGLTNLDVSNFKTDNVTDMRWMFYGCSSLTTIYIGNGWSTEAVTNGSSMFTDCVNLVGGAGTAYDSNHTDYTYAHIDGGENNPGYFTDIESVRRWNFTKWSSETIANLKADAAASKTTGWSDVEKKADAEAGAEPTEAAKDNCFWLDAETTEANGVAIAELEGLVFNKSYCSSRKLAIAVNYPSTSLGDYAGGAYLWLGGKDSDCFTIPNVKNGQTITIELESHKTSEGRGITLIAGSTELDSFTTMSKASYSWTIPEDCDVVVRNTNGCHIYTITVSGEGTPTDTLEIYAVETGSTITPNQPIMATQSVVVTPGNDVEWLTNMSMGSAWVNPLDFTSNIYYPGSTTTYTFEGSMRGTNNPKDGDLEDGVSTGSGYKPYQKNFPKSGGFLTFEVQQEGSLIVPIRVFAGKPLYVTDKTGTAKKDIQFKDASGQTLALQTNPLCAVSADEDVTGFVSFNVQPGEKYYVFSVGSKARFGGYVFSKQAIDIDPATMANVVDSLDALPITLEPYAVLTTDTTSVLSSDSTGVTYGKTLTFYYDNQKEVRNGMSVGPFFGYPDDYPAWHSSAGSITQAVFDVSFANCSSITSTAYWFYECSKLSQIEGIENLKTDSVTTMGSMFESCSGLTTLDVSYFNTANVTEMWAMFKGCSSLTSLDVSHFNTQNVTSMAGMFDGCSSLTSLDVSGFSTVNVTVMNYMFSGCSGLTTLDVSHFNTENVTYISGMFFGCSSLTSLDVSNFKTDNVTDMSGMFAGCSGLTSLDVSGFNTDNVTNMSWMFGNCSGLTNLDVSNFKTDNVTNMSWMFGNCSCLTSLDVSNFNTSKVTSMFTMFYGCSGLTSLDLSSFNTGNVTSMQSMFYNCSGLTSLDVSNFNTDNVTDMSWMFSKCSSLTSLDLSSFNTSNVKYEYDANNYINYSFGIKSMFEGCSALTTIWVGDNWTTANLTESVDVFKDCAALVGGAGTHFDPDHVDYTYAHIDGGTSNPGYLTSIADTAAVAPVTFACENNELTLLCETPNTTIWYAVNQNVTDTLDVKSVTIAEFNAAEVSNDVWYRLTGTVHNLKDDDRYGNFNLQDETDSVYVYGLLSEKDGEKQKFQELVAEKGITNGSTITIIGHRGEYKGKVEVVNAYYDNGEGDWQQYTAPLALDSDCTVKAYAARPSGIRSAISSYVFKKTDRPKVETPTFAWENDKLLISSATEDATIYYSVKEFTTEPTGDGTLASPYNVAAALQYINTLEGDSPSSDSIFVKGVVSDIKDVSPQYGNATFYITDIGKTGGNYLYAYRVKDVGNQNISSEDAVKLGDEVIIRGLVVKYRGVTPETVQGAAYIYAYTTPEMNTLYESPIAVSDNVIVRAKATKQDMSDSEMAMLSVSSEPYALLSENNTKLTFYYDKLKDAKGGMGVGPFIQSYNTETGSYYLQGREWEDHAGDITTVEFDPSFGNCTTITNMVGWFFENTKLQTINGLEYLNTSNVTNMLALFNGCTSLTSLDLSTFDTHNVTNMRGMFYGCTSLTTLNVSSFNTSNVLGFNSMFNNCTSLKSIDVSRFDTKNATSLRMMFLNCHSLEALDITNFETSNVTDMYYVFGGLQLPSIDLSKMNTEKVETMEGLFSHTAFTSLDLSSFNTSQVKNMYSMFANSSNLQTIYVGDGWSTESIVITDSTSYGSRLFYGCEKLVGGKGTVYDASHIDVTYAHIDGGTSNPGYFTDKNAPVIEATFDGRVLAVGGSTTMTDALESVGGRDEVAKTITAIVWNSSAALTNSDLQGLDNPNLLIYVNERSLAPQDRNNVVVNGLAMNVVLSDTGSGNCDFYAPQTFTAEMITYSREFKQATQVGVCRGWETISLPFMVQTIAHADNGVITPFGVDTSNKHFWLRQLSTNGLVSATKIEANVPYLISMPNDEKNYAKEYILKGLVTFSAQNAVVPKTEPMALALADSSIVMMPALQSVGKSSTVWALNVGQERSQYFEGSTFERDYREVRPFEAYTIHRSDTPAPRFLPINDLMNSATGIETISNVIMSHDNYYRLDGRKVDGKPTKKGLYITNGRKVVVK